MKSKKIVVSLLLMFIVVMGFAVNVYADNVVPQTVVPITTGNVPVTSSSGNAVPISISTNQPAGETAIGNQPDSNTPANVPVPSNNATPVNNNLNSSKSGLPYTGSSYKVVFVIIALIISAIYAYKKVSDYNV